MFPQEARPSPTSFIASIWLQCFFAFAVLALEACGSETAHVERKIAESAPLSLILEPSERSQTGPVSAKQVTSLPPPTHESPTTVRLRSLERQVLDLQRQLDAIERQNAIIAPFASSTAHRPPVAYVGSPVSAESRSLIREADSFGTGGSSALQASEPNALMPCCSDQDSVSGDGACPRSTHFVTYDDGWTLRPKSPKATPFELKFNFHNQFRYTGFVRSNDTFTDAAGNTRLIKNRNDFDINRGRFVVSGYAFNPRLKYYTNIDYNTVATNPILLLLSWLSYDVSERCTVFAGLGKVPGTWEWIETSRYTLGAERTMATTFFRPSITAGVWTRGKLTDDVHYQALIGDGFNSLTLRASQLDTNLAYSGSVWWEPRGPFGIGFSDLECHDKLAFRLGHGLTYTRNGDEPSGSPGPEQTFIRLSDGTRIVEPGAIAPGVTVNQFDITLYAAHFGLKRHGWSFATEYFLRWLTSIEGTGPLPIDSLMDHGFFVQGGYFILPKRLEAYGIGSHVTGDYGSGTEIGGGLNWYAGGKRGNRFTFDVVHLDSPPAEQDRTGFVAGASGTLFRTQWWTFF